MPLSPAQKGQLETVAVHAFSGRVQPDLTHGFRINTARGQVAAIYWSDNAPGNDVEIAVCDSRVTEKYPLTLVHQWIDAERQRSPNLCNVHKHGSDWPIIGFSYQRAIDFLQRCRKLRRGTLDPQEVTLLRSAVDLSSAEERSRAQLRAVLASLRPSEALSIYDLVYRAGVSVAPWHVRKDGSPASSPRSNPAYCYNWSFGGGAEPALACLWHESLAISGNEIQFHGNLRLAAQRLDVVERDVRQEREIRNRARQQAGRAHRLDELLRVAAEAGRPVRVVLNEGHMRSEENLGVESSEVRVRRLDDAPWEIRSYNDATGEVVLVRRPESAVDVEPPLDSSGVVLPKKTDLSAEALAEPSVFIDQHHAAAGADMPEKVVLTGEAYLRDRAVRDKALARAAGRCELCGAHGFRTVSGKVYLETHHVIPLAEDGADKDWNVAALCPNDHRQAHFGERAPEIRAQLLAFLAQRYPREVSQSAQALV